MERISPNMLSVLQRGFQEINEAYSEIHRLLDLIEKRRSGQQAVSEDNSDNTRLKARKKHVRWATPISTEKEELNGETDQTVTSEIDRAVTEREHRVLKFSAIDNRLRQDESDSMDCEDRENALPETDDEDQVRIVSENEISDSESSSLEEEFVSGAQEDLNKRLNSKVTDLSQDNRLDDEFKDDSLEYLEKIEDSENIDSDTEDEIEAEVEVEINEFYAKEIDQTPRKEADRITKDVELWRSYAKSECKKGWLAKALHEDGLNTIFCLDTSMSMKGKPLKQAKVFIRHYIQGIQSTKPTDNGYEHVALVTFGGGETRVQQHLTTQYFELLTKLECVRPNGPSPLFAGLRMCWATVVGAGITSSSLDDKNSPKVYLLTDGQVTPTSLFAGPDTCTEDEEKLVENQVLHYCIYLHKTYNLSISAICVHDCKMSILEQITAQTNGEMVTTGDWTLDPKPAESKLVAAADYDDVVDVDDDDDDDDDSFQQSLHCNGTEQYTENSLSDGSSTNSDGNEEGVIKVESYDSIRRYIQQYTTNRDSDVGTAAEDTKSERFSPVLESADSVTENLREASSIEKQAFTWRWKDSGGMWKPYSDEINKAIESYYEKDPRGFVIIIHDNKQYKIIFSRMVKIDMKTKEKFPVSRR